MKQDHKPKTNQEVVMKIHKMFLAALMLALMPILNALAQTRVTPTSTINQAEPYLAVNATN